jgi:ribosomal protein L7Ae-like RNA K-turn-binding protein
MQENKFYRFMGIAKKSGAVIAGDHMVEKELNRGSLRLVVVANDTSPRILAKYLRFCQELSIPVLQVGTKEALGKAIGKEQAAVIGFKDKNQCENLIRLYENTIETGGVL